MKKIFLCLLTVMLLVGAFCACGTEALSVPNLVGTVYDENATYADGISVPKEKVSYAYSDTAAAGVIISQTPAPGVQTSDVTQVELSLVVSLGAEKVDFSLPEEYRTSYEAACAYLTAPERPYTGLSVVASRYADAHVEGKAGNSVVGAFYQEDPDTLLSLDGDQVTKSKNKNIVLLLNPYKTETILLKDSALHNAENAKEYMEKNYPFLTVAGVEAFDESLYDRDLSMYPKGTVMAIRREDGTFVHAFMNEGMLYLTYTGDAREEEIVLLVTGVCFRIEDSLAQEGVDAVKAYIEENYSFLTVTGSETGENTGDPVPSGTVIGIRYEQGDAFSLKDAYILKENKNVILITAP